MQFKTHLHEGLGGYSLYIVPAEFHGSDGKCSCHDGHILVSLPTGTGGLDWDENHRIANAIVDVSNGAEYLIVSDAWIATGVRVTDIGQKAMRP